MEKSLEIRLNAIFYLPFVIAPISFIGSVLTILTIYRAGRLRRGRNNRNGSSSSSRCSGWTTYHRLFFMTSIFDIILSLGYVLGPIPMPSEVRDRGVPLARGTVATCTLQGFLMQLGSGSFCYMSMIMLYYVLIIRFNVQQSTIEKKAEPILHAIPLLYYIITSVLGLFLEVYNPSAPVCWVNAYPPGCDELGSETDCERGEDYSFLFGTWLLTYSIMGWNLLIFACLMIVATTVRSQTRRIRLYSFGGTTASRVQETQTNVVITQCFLYGFSFLNNLVWGTVATIYFLAGKDFDSLGKHFYMTFLGGFFFPLQGFFNFLIFIRPRYFKLRRSYKDIGRLFALYEAIWQSQALETDASGLCSPQGRIRAIGSAASPNQKVKSSDEQNQRKLQSQKAPLSDFQNDINATGTSLQNENSNTKLDEEKSPTERTDLKDDEDN